MEFNEGNNLSIIISSFLKVNERLDILKRVIINLRNYFPKSEIIVLFDKFGVNSLEGVDKCITHNKGLGYTFNYGCDIASNEFILQTEDDWIIKPYITKEQVNYLLESSYNLLKNNKMECIRIDAAMFSEIGKSIGYPLGYQEYIFNDIKYYIYNLPSDKDMENNKWLKYYFCNHPHFKLKKIMNKFKYIEDVPPNKVEHNACILWRQLNYNCGYIHIDKIFKDSLVRHIGGKFSFSKYLTK
jgi:hypothetical protein